jgi:hypothetical protein
MTCAVKNKKGKQRRARVPQDGEVGFVILKAWVREEHTEKLIGEQRGEEVRKLAK